MRTLLICVAFAGCAGLFGACNGRSPAAPSSLPLASPPPVAAAAANLLIERLSIKVIPQTQGDKFGYEPRFQLREIGGKSGATIQNVSVVAPNGGSDDAGPICWRDVIRVAPNTVLDTFYSHDGANWLGYCAPWSAGNSDRPDLRIVVTFADDEGHTGRVEGRATIGG